LTGGKGSQKKHPKPKYFSFFASRRPSPSLGQRQRKPSWPTLPLKNQRAPLCHWGLLPSPHFLTHTVPFPSLLGKKKNQGRRASFYQKQRTLSPQNQKNQYSPRLPSPSLTRPSPAHRTIPAKPRRIRRPPPSFLPLAFSSPVPPLFPC